MERIRRSQKHFPGLTRRSSDHGKLDSCEMLWLRFLLGCSIVAGLACLLVAGKLYLLSF